MSDRKGEFLPLVSLVEAARRGDRAKFDCLMLACGDLVRRPIRKRMGARLRAVVEPEDVEQDVLVGAFRGITKAKFDGEGAFRRWIATLVRNRLIDLRRLHFGTQRRIPSAWSLEDRVPDSQAGAIWRRNALLSSDPSLSAEARRHERAEALARAMSRLSAEHQDLLRMLEREHLTVKEIAARTGKTPGAVQKMIRRALDACAVAFGPNGSSDLAESRP